MSFTPGPWSRIDPHDSHICVGPDGSVVVADVWGDEADYFDYTTPDMDTAEANARLIAAAPELLEAARLVTTSDPESAQRSVAVERLRAAIERVEDAKGGG